MGGRRAGGGPVRERPDLRNTCPLRRFQAQKDPKKVRIWEVGGGNGPTSQIRALYGVFRPKKTQKRYTYLGGRRAGGGSGPGMARPRKYVPFTAFSGPKRPKKRYVFGRRGGPVRERPFSGPKRPKKGTYLGGWRRGGGRVRERPDLRNTCPLRRFQAKKTQKRYVFGRSAGVRRSRPPERVQVFFAKCFTLLFSLS